MKKDRVNMIEETLSQDIVCGDRMALFTGSGMGKAQRECFAMVSPCGGQDVGSMVWSLAMLPKSKWTEVA